MTPEPMVWTTLVYSLKRNCTAKWTLIFILHLVKICLALIFRVYIFIMLFDFWVFIVYTQNQYTKVSYTHDWHEYITFNPPSCNTCLQYIFLPYLFLLMPTIQFYRTYHHYSIPKVTYFKFYKFCIRFIFTR